MPLTETLNYARPSSTRRSKVLRRLAVTSLFLPLLVVASIYGEWLLAWGSLGHAPRPSLDDPKAVVGSSWMHGVSALAMLGAVPAAFLALGLNIADIAVNRAPTWRGITKIAILIVSWLGFIALFWWDPGAVFYWWFD